ncbi:hypothetical protein ACTQX5_02565 [Faecalicoccus sp. LCP19S3_E3]|uniref:hypothetical protein n=1 Tax=unclassified Faecalicoccus TaxID=2643311 RepID=UPI003F93715C
MSTKEECEKALDHFEKCYWDQDNSYGAMNGVRKDLDILNKLIHEHFYNPPLKFEELKEGMFVWDKKQNTWIEISEISEYQNIKFYMIGWECKETILYEPNRFYWRKI